MDLQGNHKHMWGEAGMFTIARFSDTDREVLFGNAANRAGIRNPAIRKMDFFHCCEKRTDGKQVLQSRNR